MQDRRRGGLPPRLPDISFDIDIIRPLALQYFQYIKTARQHRQTEEGRERLALNKAKGQVRSRRRTVSSSYRYLVHQLGSPFALLEN